MYISCCNDNDFDKYYIFIICCINIYCIIIITTVRGSGNLYIIAGGLIQCSMAIKLWKMGNQGEGQESRSLESTKWEQTQGPGPGRLKVWMNFFYISHVLKIVLVEYSDFFIRNMVLKLVTCSDPHKSQDQIELCLVCPKCSFWDGFWRFLQGALYPYHDTWQLYFWQREIPWVLQPKREENI